MSQREYNKYKPLSALGFDKRSPEDKALALERPKLAQASVMEATFTRDSARRESTPFHYDQRLITGDFLYRRLGAMGQLAPTFSPGFQNRMTHSQHVADISGRLADRMHLGRKSGAMARAMAFAHDIGHAPFSHEGETVFNQRLQKYGKAWDHDDFGFRLLTEFAHGGFSYYGVPLSNGVVEGIIKRYKRFGDAESDRDHFNRPLTELPPSARNGENFNQSLMLNQWSPIEGQIASISDWIAGTVSDTRDLLNMELSTSTPREFEAYCETLMEKFPAAKEVWQNVEAGIQKIEQETPQQGLSKHTYYARMSTKIATFSEYLEEYLVEDVLEETLSRYNKHKGQIRHAGDIRHIEEGLVSFSPKTFQAVEQYESFKKEHVYPKLLKENANTLRLMDAFFTIVEDRFKDPSLNSMEIADTWRNIYESIETDSQLPEGERNARLTTLVAEYIACNFTDADVIYFVRQIKPELYEEEIMNGKKGIYPRLAHSDTPETFAKRIQAEQALTESQTAAAR